MAEFKITRFRYTWRDSWSGSSVTYNRDDVVYHQGSTWVCVRQHVSDVFDDAQTYTAPGDTFASPAWVKMVEGREWTGLWTNNRRYDLGALIQTGGNLYLCVASHVSSTNFDSDFANWEILAVGNNFRNTWQTTTRYKVNDVVRYNGYTYQCVLEHTSGTVSQGVGVGNNDGNDDSTAETWTSLVENYTFVGNFQLGNRYRVNDLIQYGKSILRCISEHTTVGSIDNSKFTTYLSGFSFNNEWNNSTYYAQGDVIRHGGILFVAVENNYNWEPGITNLHPDENSAWQPIEKATNYTGVYDFQAAAEYKEGDLVRRGGSLWVALTNQITDDSSLAPFDTSNWELVIASQNHTGAWIPGRYYNLNELAYFRGVVYSATTPHFSSFDNFPGDNGSGFDYWTIVIIGDENAGLMSLGDLLTYNLKRDVIQVNGELFDVHDTSTLGVTNVPIGEENQFLTVKDNTGNIFYKDWGTLQRVFFVKPNGVDDDTDPLRGVNYFRPWKTLRYALEKADDGYEGFTTITVATGRYEEILPLIVPVRTVVIGEELRAVTIAPNQPIDALANDAFYTLETLRRIQTIIEDVVIGIDAPVSPGNIEIQNTTVTSTPLIATVVSGLLGDSIYYIDFIVNDEGSLPAVTGSNTETLIGARLNAITCLDNNRNFIKQEALAFMVSEYPSYNFDTTKCLRDIDKFIDAIQYDLRYPGNYKSVLAGRYYANAVVGSQSEDMFYVRDTTGLRNLTMFGLEGTLPALQEGEVYRLPTGGSFVSLDPGWGPDDDRVWITSRSCYVQNCTTFGTGAVGQKVDGLLHNGGNKSIVSNDFTQVISDGIGAWVQNGGRVELVSVFTYYSHIGMFAKSGGIIRATNGNSSYGDFGAVADGNDPAEVPKYGYLNTRTTQAEVASAFAGEILDYILGLEYVNAGQNYTTATYSFTSSGTGAVAVHEEIRDNAIFQTQVLTEGSGFSQFGNQAQLGNEYQIILATSETAEASDILGMRIIIISGEGTGQYGYVYSYDSLTKVCIVYRESDNQPGWDHINPGTPSNPLLTTGTRYRIEPRPIFSAPPFTATEVGLSTSISPAAAVYGETSETFNDIVCSVGNGTTIDVPVAQATFNVVKTGRTYTVTLVDGGAGYAVGDVVIINGGLVGGTSGEHDIELTVITTTDDSTNSIETFRIPDETLIASSGKFVITPSNSNLGFYSTDGDNWYQITLPRTGDWRCLASGDNRFVAIMNNSNGAAYSTDGINWTFSSIVNTRNWNSIAYGKPSGVSQGVFVAVAENLNSGSYTINGASWTAFTLPTAGDSTLSDWVDIAFGAGVFVAIASSANVVAVGTWDGSALTWTTSIMDVIADSSRKNWTSIAYGNRRFVAIADTGEVGYSFDGLVWYPATMPPSDGSTIHNWKKIRYGQGVFFAVGDTGSKTVLGDPTTGPTTFAATSYDGIVWESRELASTENWGVLAFGNPDVTLGDSTLSNSKPTWIIAPTAQRNVLNKVYTGARTLGRVALYGAGISNIKLWEPGSGYYAEPTLTLVDPNNVDEPTYRHRIADGVLAQPKFVQRGSSYKTSTTTVTVVGDGFADVTPDGNRITVDNLTMIPRPGAQFHIGGSDNYFTAVVVGIDQTELADGTIRSTFQITPSASLTGIGYFEHGMEVRINEKYSQVRLTGHDFLDVGSGNFETTNYPTLYTDYVYNTAPEQETYDLNGGRVFYTSTDQNGNFRAGKLFAVEQATGYITISADFFNLTGLTELRLAGVSVGSTAIIREFSKDPLFLQNSNNVVPTQRAIRSYLQSRLNIGGEDLLTPSFIAGTVRVGPNLINSTAGLAINVNVIADFSGNGAGISGSYLAQTMFIRGFRDGM